MVGLLRPYLPAFGVLALVAFLLAASMLLFTRGHGGLNAATAAKQGGS